MRKGLQKASSAQNGGLTDTLDGHSDKAFFGASESVKTCSKCLKVKTVTEFFYRSREGRHESACKDCRRLERLRGRRGTKQKAAIKAVAPKKSAATPLVEKITEVRCAKTAEIVENADFSVWRVGDATMSYAERSAAVQRFNEFVALLLDGYGEIVGSDVYLRKD